jgi:nitroreductase
MELSDIISQRRSVRKYTAQAVDEALLRQILEAGRLAPTARNEQNWYCVVVKSEETRRRMVQACGDQTMVAEAPVDLVICGTQDRNMLCGQSTATVNAAIATTFMMLKATELGLGTCWLGRFSAEQVKDLLGVPAADSVVAVMPLGYADEAPSPRPRKPLSEFTR